MVVIFILHALAAVEIWSVEQSKQKFTIFFVTDGSSKQEDDLLVMHFRLEFPSKCDFHVLSLVSVVLNRYSSCKCEQNLKSPIWQRDQALGRAPRVLSKYSQTYLSHSLELEFWVCHTPSERWVDRSSLVCHNLWIPFQQPALACHIWILQLAMARYSWPSSCSCSRLWVILRKSW